MIAAPVGVAVVSVVPLYSAEGFTIDWVTLDLLAQAWASARCCR